METYSYSLKFINAATLIERKAIIINSQEFVDNEKDLSFKKSDIKDENFSEVIKEIGTINGYKKILILILIMTLF